MSVQRKRYGKTIVVYEQQLRIDSRGNRVVIPHEGKKHTVKAVVIPQRGARAEVPGQRVIEVYRVLVDPTLENVTLWSRVEIDGRPFDIVSPPALRKGISRRASHWVFDVRARGGI